MEWSKVEQHTNDVRLHMVDARSPHLLLSRSRLRHHVRLNAHLLAISDGSLDRDIRHTRSHCRERSTLAVYRRQHGADGAGKPEEES